MKRLIELIFMAFAMFSLAACTSDTLVSPDDNTTPTPSSDNVPINFGAYTSGSKTTRAGVGGAMTDEELKKNGFGVFAINTDTRHYDDVRDSLTELSEPPLSAIFNFMLNEKVSYKDGSWKCETPKYWPNPTYVNGEERSQYVSFFAYAPYTPVQNWIDQEVEYGCAYAYNEKTKKNEDENADGIVYFYSNNTHYDYEESGSVLYSTYNPTIIYSSSPVDKAENASCGKKQVDLLWGTAGSNGKSWDNKEQKGEGYKIYDPTINAESDESEEGINAVGTVNIDLTKMTTNGNVSFIFKHALASLGGNTSTGTESSTDDNSFTIDAIDDVVRGGGSETSEGESGNTTGLKDNNRISVNWIVIEVQDKHGSTYNTSKGYFDLVNGAWVLASGEGEDLNPPVYYVIAKSSDNNDTKLQSIVKDSLGLTTDNASYVFANLNDNICLTSDGKTYDQLVGNQSNWNTGVKNGVTTSKQNPCAANSDPFLFIPDYNGKAEITIAVSYDIVCPDANYNESSTHKGYTIAHQKQTATVTTTDNMKLNTKYNLHLHLGVNSMKVNAIATDWTTDSQNSDLPANANN